MHLRVLLTLILLFGIACVDEAIVSAEPPKVGVWIVEPAQAVAILETSTILDTRNMVAFGMNHVKGSTRVSWKEFSQTGTDGGKLLSTSVLEEKLRKYGVSNEKLVLVVGDPVGGWGEDGRIAWMLRTLGHTNTAIVNGGHAALKAAGAPTKMGTSTTQTPGDFVAKFTSKYDVTTEVLQAALGKDDHAILDTRELREYEGETPYGEIRGGHVPGAKHLHYRELLESDGRLLSAAKLTAKLDALGVKKNDDIYAYCTGGVRSGWFVVVLQHLGYTKARNYAGSMWEWAAGSPDAFPLEK